MTWFHPVYCKVTLYRPHLTVFQWKHLEQPIKKIKLNIDYLNLVIIRSESKQTVKISNKIANLLWWNCHEAKGQISKFKSQNFKFRSCFQCFSLRLEANRPFR